MKRKMTAMEQRAEFKDRIAPGKPLTLCGLPKYPVIGRFIRLGLKHISPLRKRNNGDAIGAAN